MMSLYRLVIVFSLLTLAPVNLVAQNNLKWIPFAPGTTYRPVDWSSVVIVVFNHLTHKMSLYGITANIAGPLGELDEGGAVASRIKNDLQSNSRWFAGWPQINGAYLKPAAAEAFVDLSKAPSAALVHPIDTASDTFVVQFNGSVPSIGIVDDAQRQRAQKFFDATLKDF